VFLGLFVFLLRHELHQFLALPAGIIVGFIGFVVISGRDWMPHHRFIAPILPLLALFIMVALNAFKRKILRLSVIIIAVIGIGFEITMAYTLYRPLNTEFGLYTEGLIQAGERVKQFTSESANIAVVDAGALAYYGERKTIDILGINNEHIAHSPGKIDIEYVLNQRPQLIQLHVGFTDEGKIITPQVGSHNQMFLDHPNFLECYSPDLTRPSDPYYPFVFRRVCD
jgi:hypothetical protein